MPHEMTPDVAAVVRLLERVRQRLLVRHVLQGTAGAAGLSVVLWLAVAILGRSPSLAILIAAAIGAALFAILLRKRRAPSQVATRIERAWPACRNIVVTAEELVNDEGRPDWVRSRVLRDAAAVLAPIPLGAIGPLTRPLVAAAVSLLALAVVAVVIRPRTLDRFDGLPGSVTAQAGERAPAARVHLQPPAYTRQPATTVDNPARLDVIEGTHARVELSSSGPRPRIRFVDRAIALHDRASLAVAEMTLVESGYLAIERDGGMTLIAVNVTADRAPAVKVDRPARDVILPDARAAVDVAATATDDLALDAMTLRYTKVSGSGEQFEFVEGQLPIVVSRETAQTWRGAGRISLAALGLEPGDSLVYRVTAQDQREGAAGLGSSDTYFIEVAGPGQIPLEGFEMPPEEERYALSQQMIVLKIERLRGKERAAPRERVVEETAAIAAEQRSVRANFVFLIGGHVEDEEEEAEQEHEIQEGRLENTSRRDISRAVGYMSTTEQALSGVNTAVALEQARLAVAALQRAFGRNRYLLRTLPVRSRIDQSRRLSGSLADARGLARDAPEVPEDSRSIRTRALLKTLLTYASRDRAPAADAALLADAAEQALSVAPGDAAWQHVAARLLAIRLDVTAGRSDGQPLRDVIRTVADHAHRDLPAVSSNGTISSRLHSAWSEAQRR